MIQLPPGFDVSALFSDFAKYSLPFVVIAGLFVAFDYIRKIITILGDHHE